MYTYYLLAAALPQDAQRKWLWWKRYITTLQLAQFCVAFLHNAQLLWQDCGFPRWSVCFTLPNAIFFYYLFNDFYQRAYGTSDKNRVDIGIMSSNGVPKKRSKPEPEINSNDDMRYKEPSIHSNGKIQYRELTSNSNGDMRYKEPAINSNSKMHCKNE